MFGILVLSPSSKPKLEFSRFQVLNVHPATERLFTSVCVNNMGSFHAYSKWLMINVRNEISHLRRFPW